MVLDLNARSLHFSLPLPLPRPLPMDTAMWRLAFVLDLVHLVLGATVLLPCALALAHALAFALAFALADSAIPPAITCHLAPLFSLDCSGCVPGPWKEPFDESSSTLRFIERGCSGANSRGLDCALI